jgi:integrase
MSKTNTITLSEGLSALRELTAQRVRDRVRSAATLEMQGNHARWLERELGARRLLREIDEPVLELLTVRRPDQKFGPETLRKRMSTLRGVLLLAHRRRWISRVPAFPQILAPWNPRRRLLNSYRDAVRLFEILPLHRAEWLWLCLWTGQHASDVDRMTWLDVDLEMKSMLIRNTKNRRFDGLRVGMPAPLHGVLRAKYERERPKPTDRIVRPWPSRSHTLLRACYKLGLPPINAIDLRHTCFSWAVRKLGITPGIVAWAGHSSPAMMARTYARHLPPALLEVTRELESFAQDTEFSAAPANANGAGAVVTTSDATPANDNGAPEDWGEEVGRG